MSLETPQINYSSEKNFPKIIELNQDQETQDVFVKAFLIDDSTNKNFWNVPAEAMKKHATSFIGRPLILHPSGNHPDYIKEGVVHDSANFVQDVLKVQDNYKVGEIIDVREETRKGSNDKAWYAYVRMTNPDAVSKLKQGSVPYYVSPQVYDLNEANNLNGDTTDFIPLHLAIVEEPAYGNRANIKGICNGKGTVCMKALKSAATVINDYVSQQEHSSLIENSANNDHTKLAHQNYDENLHNNVGNNYQNGNSGIPTGNNNANAGNTSNLISEQKKTQTLTPDGHIETKTLDIKPQNGKGSIPQTQGNEQQNNLTSNPAALNGNPNPLASQQPAGTPAQPQGQGQESIDASKLQSNEAQLPNAILDAINKMNQRIDGIEKFKSGEEEKQIKKAAEDKRAIAEGYITEQVIADPSARENMVTWLSSLPVGDEDLKRLCELITTGGFQSASVDDKSGKKETKKHTIKSAAVQNEATLNPYYRTGIPVNNNVDFFDDVDFGNI